MNKAKDKDLAKSKALVKEYQATNKQLMEFLHQAIERASDAERRRPKFKRLMYIQRVGPHAYSLQALIS